MAYDQRLADRVRRALAPRTDIEERAMFGGLAFMARGHLCCGLVNDKLMVRVGPDGYTRFLRERGAEPMDFTGRPMRGFLYVNPIVTATSSGLRRWVSRALDFVESRPPKTSGKPAKAKTRPRSKPQPARVRH